MGSGPVATSVEQACVWSLIQSFSLHHSVHFLQYLNPADDNSIIPRNITNLKDSLMNLTDMVESIVEDKADVIEDIKDTSKEKIEENQDTLQDLIDKISQ